MNKLVSKLKKQTEERLAKEIDENVKTAIQTEKTNPKFSKSLMQNAYACYLALNKKNKNHPTIIRYAEIFKAKTK